ncbi:MAG: alpha/beta hydrolase, partial [Fimbriimonas ginsengisoli]|nr:alpha/beta hydrolase [Fimbriimonas ginsengisoli]
MARSTASGQRPPPRAKRAFAGGFIEHNRWVRPDTYYALSEDGVHIAYQTIGEGPVDLIYCSELWSSIEALWDHPDCVAYLQALAKFCRVIIFDQRGNGLSDPVALKEVAALDAWVQDVQAVKTAVGSERAVLLGSGGGGMLAMMFAALHPAEPERLIVLNSHAKMMQSADYPEGATLELEQRVRRQIREGWGRGVMLDLVAPSKVGDPAFLEWWARYQRLGGSPGVMLAIREALAAIDIRHVLPAIRVP